MRDYRDGLVRIWLDSDVLSTGAWWWVALDSVRVRRSISD